MSCLPFYPSKRGYYSLQELKILAIVLGYDGNIFQRGLKRHGININMKSSYSETDIRQWLLGYDGNIFQRGLKRHGININMKSSYSETDIRQWLHNNYFYLDLDHIFNSYAADYNVKVIRKAMFHLHLRLLTFNEIASTRRAFETITAKERQLSLSTNPEQVLYALKMVDRVMSPVKLQQILLAMSRYWDDSPTSLSLYDFMDVVAKAECIHVQRFNKRLQSDNELQIETLFKTPYHRLLSSLDDEFKESLIRVKMKKSTNNSTKPITEKMKEGARSSISIKYREIASNIMSERHSITPSITRSSTAVKSARAGHRSLTSDEITRALNRRTSHQNRII
jgi:hypothetical protein